MVPKVIGLKEIGSRLMQAGLNSVDRIRYMKGARNSSLSGVSAAEGFGKRCFFNGNVTQEIARIHTQMFGSGPSNLLEEADMIFDHRFSVLGYKELCFGDESHVDWHLDPVNRIKAPLVWWQDIDCFNTQVVGDPKIIWELNRHQHFVSLALAYRLTGNAKYREGFLELLESWFVANPPKFGINWASSLELAFRSIAWVWSYNLFGGEEELPDQVVSKLISFLVIQGEHIEHNLSTYFSPNTHLTGEALGLFYLGLFLEGGRVSNRWIRKGREILLSQLPRHVLPDGGYVERSLWYHRYTLEIYLHFHLLADRYGLGLPKNVKAQIERLGEFLMYSSKPDGTLPLIGDDDGGQLLHFGVPDGSNLKGIFSTLSVLFQRGDFKYLSRDFQPETLWLLGPSSKEAYDHISAEEPKSTSKGFSQTGYFFMRGGWSRDASYLAFDCGPHGWLNCGHAHADLLSFQVWSDNTPIIADAGTYTYAGPLRDYFRGPDGHSVVKLDGRYPAAMGGPFSWEKIPEFDLIRWRAGAECDYISGFMKGNDWTHSREILFVKPDVFLIRDSVGGVGRHEIEMRFPLVGKEWRIEEGKCLLKKGERGFSIECLDENGLTPELIDSWVSMSYGNKLASYALLFTGAVFLPFTTTFLVNLSGQESQIEDSAEVFKEYLRRLPEEPQSEPLGIPRERG